MELVLRRSTDRDWHDLGWLKTFHSFRTEPASKGKYEQWGSLRVLNEDRVEPHTGFGLHFHKEFEIFTYVVAGELEHKDSMGNAEILRRGDIQMTSAGTGIRHSEHSYGDKQVHFLQIWAFPSEAHLSPKYYTRHVGDDEKRDKLAIIVAPVDAPGVVDKRDAEGPTPIHSRVTAYASILGPNNTIKHVMGSTMVHVHLVQTSGFNTKAASGAQLQLNGAVELREGDGAFGKGVPGSEIKIENMGGCDGEIVIFDV